MTNEIFEIRLDESAGAWFLDTPVRASGEEILGAEFRRGVRWDLREVLRSKIYSCGHEVGVSRGGRGTFYVAKNLMDVLKSIIPDARLQGVPVDIAESQTDYEILNVLDVVDCVDETRSEFGKWKEEDGRPEMVGRYRGIPRMVVDPKKTDGHDLFLVKNWEVSMLCSRKIMDALVDAGVTGVRFEPVETSDSVNSLS